ncbi:outer membrane lipid asymmetry maintenance protein MlaD [Desulfovibrio subterraneus]|jgi:phospholipid/cholesterol/gamma-HCH transport system substrate-binding protein|uniref:Outer membrane lipid asymmetry maintenance protein MlaD n=1 Tax=Desulfovibrio subterraneus TaxID=2718620 RepID=A0A7J0BI47_9BACT|nr:outer membrane lipid asymmetry maintenance protein MlaD [Desulfovibrio subterraneus]WBF67545.1 outer membrane lipid asymmetry maintenance protein MlaD [Desulfovibrio subterraneus]GFM33380.1 outer membrane lipid asymmetry maintenance protein MlaD [Desulfovibrio subterraneus]
MKKYAKETSVGVFVLICLLCVGYLTIKLGKMEVMGADTYTVTARFASITGLRVGADVEIAGVPVGKVASITLDQQDSLASVALAIRKDVELTDDVIASVKTSGLIGDKYIKLAPGGSTTTLGQGDEITETESAVDIEELISKYVFGGVK